MRFRLGFATGFAAGYYLGAKAGRERYEQISRTIAKVRRSEAYETATDKAREVVDLGKDQARHLAGKVTHRGDEREDVQALDGFGTPPPFPGAAHP